MMFLHVDLGGTKKRSMALAGRLQTPTTLILVAWCEKKTKSNGIKGKIEQNRHQNEAFEGEDYKQNRTKKKSKEYDNEIEMALTQLLVLLLLSLVF